jgi:hypothetical protein
MTKVRGVTGGGYDGNKVSQVNAPKQEPKPHPVSMGAVSRLGGMVGEGTPFKSLYSNYNKVTASNPVGPTPSVAGPGGGRVVMKAGSQSSTPKPHPMGSGRSLFK